VPVAGQNGPRRGSASGAVHKHRLRGTTLLYRWTRDLHLYFGLFISPFVLLFSASVLFLNHAKVPTDKWTSVDTTQNLQIPEGMEMARGPEAVARAQVILAQLDVAGEIGFTRYVKATQRFVFPVSRPGLETLVDVNLGTRSATVSRRATSMWEALAYLHKMPGPHNVNIRGNWFWTRVWRWFADATVYLLLFMSMSGIYLWYAIKAERKIGFVLLGAGAVTFSGLIYAVIR
jgi:hypothetical protein